jgi:DNA-binding GntR family transcriptional regulator
MEICSREDVFMAITEKPPGGDAPIDAGSLRGILSICELLREGIRSGEYGDSRLPDEFSLIRDLGVSRTRLRAALEVLGEEGLVVRRRGRGTFISRRRLNYRTHDSGGFVSTLSAQQREASHQLISASTWAMDPLTAAEFGARPGVPMHVIERLTHLDQEPLALSAYVVRADLAPAMLSPELLDRNRDMRTWLSMASTVEISHVDVLIEAYPADAHSATYLGCEAGDALLRTNRRFVTAAGDLLAHGHSTHRGDRYAIQAERELLHSRTNQSDQTKENNHGRMG